MSSRPYGPAWTSSGADRLVERDFALSGPRPPGLHPLLYTTTRNTMILRCPGMKPRCYVARIGRGPLNWRVRLNLPIPKMDQARSKTRGSWIMSHHDDRISTLASDLGQELEHDRARLGIEISRRFVGENQ